MTRQDAALGQECHTRAPVPPWLFVLLAIGAALACATFGDGPPAFNASARGPQFGKAGPR
jgi:hypothetical protein